MDPLVILLITHERLQSLVKELIFWTISLENYLATTLAASRKGFRVGWTASPLEGA